MICTRKLGFIRGCSMFFSLSRLPDRYISVSVPFWHCTALKPFGFGESEDTVRSSSRLKAQVTVMTCRWIFKPQSFAISFAFPQESQLWKHVLNRFKNPTLWIWHPKSSDALMSRCLNSRTVELQPSNFGKEALSHWFVEPLEPWWTEPSGELQPNWSLEVQVRP